MGRSPKPNLPPPAAGSKPAPFPFPPRTLLSCGGKPAKVARPTKVAKSFGQVVHRCRINLMEANMGGGPYILTPGQVCRLDRIAPDDCDGRTEAETKERMPGILK